VESAWIYLEALDERSKERLQHAFENRQDALGVFLDEAKLSDNAFAQARSLLFDLWAMLDLGWAAGVRSVTEEGLRNPDADGVPAALMNYAEEELFEAEQDDAEPLTADEAAQAGRAVETGLAALWSARKPGAES